MERHVFSRRRMKSNRAEFSERNLNFGFRRNNLNLLGIYVTCECRKAKVDVQFGRVHTMCFQQMQPNKFQSASNDFITLGYVQQKEKVGCIKGNFFRRANFRVMATLSPPAFASHIEIQRLHETKLAVLSYIIDENRESFFHQDKPKGLCCCWMLERKR